jgi:hypothetical protein
MKYNKILFLMIILMTVSCKKDSDFNADFGYDYIVNQIGSYTIYHVDSTVYNDFTKTVTDTSIELKEVVVEDFIDNLGRNAQRVERYKRAVGDTSNWELFRTFYIVKGKNNAERVDENLRYINFVFPAKENLTWEGNRFIDAVDNNKFLADWTYKFTSVDVPETINGINYPEAATIILRDNETAIEKVFAKEIYAKGVGMIYKEWQHLETQKDLEKPWPDKAEKGYIIKMYAIEHGME